MVSTNQLLPPFFVIPKTPFEPAKQTKESSTTSIALILETTFRVVGELLGFRLQPEIITEKKMSILKEFILEFILSFINKNSKFTTYLLVFTICKKK